MTSGIAALAGIGATSAADTTSAAKTAFGLSTDEFFQLFLEQLKNQDPTKPVDDKEMVAQLAQFTMIQTLSDVKSALTGSRLAEASGLIGKQVTGFNEAGDSVTGVVDRVDQSSDGFWLVVGSDRMSPDSVATVSAASATSGS